MAPTTRLVRGASVLLLLAGLAAALRALPIEALLARVQGAVGNGAMGMLGFGAAYVVSALLLVPGSALTLAAGALFGTLRGMLVVSVASTTAAALAFLAARHLARARVQALAGRHRAFRAVDRAIADGGWKVVGLLRLSPAMPFSVENYLFGLTAVGFWPYVLASWAFMLPGTALYVSLGHAGRAAAAGSRSAAEWVLLAAGLAATAGLTAYLTRRARRALAQQDLGPEAAAEATARSSPQAARTAPVVLPVIGIMAFGLGLWARSNQDHLRYLAGPPIVAQREAYAAEPDGPVFDHAVFDALQKKSLVAA